MENNLPKKYNEGIFYKIRNFFLKIFGKRTSIVNENVVNSEIVKQEQEINKNSIDVMREENTKNREKEHVLNQIERNLELIDDWPIEKLLKLEKIYDEKIKKYDVEIARLKIKEA